jgi:hypothetical protein
MKSLGLDASHFRILTVVWLRFSNFFGRIFSLKIVSLLGFRRENQVEQAVCKTRPAPKGSSANKIASFSLIKTIIIYKS